MRAALCSLLIFGLVPSALGAQTLSMFPEFQAKVVAKYGATVVDTFTSGAVRRLKLTLTDPRFLDMRTGVNDSAKVVARFAATVLPGGYLPDSVTIKIVVADTVQGTARKQTTYSATFALAKLR